MVFCNACRGRPPSRRPLPSLAPTAVLALALLLGGLLLPTSTAQAASGDTLSAVRERGVVRCGTNPIPGFGFQTTSGRWEGFFVDFCRALAAATLGDADRVEIILVESQSRWAALASGETDINVDGATWTLGRDTDMGFDFPGIYLYDGQRFLAGPSVPKGSILQAEGKSVCVIQGTTTEVNLRDFLERAELELEVIALSSDEGAWLSFTKHRCDMFVNDGIGIALRNVNHAPDPAANHLLSEVISKEPLGPVVRQGDGQWFEIVRWVLNVLIAADEQGLSSDNLAKARALVDEGDGTDRAVLLGLADDRAQALGLEPGWITRILSQVGSYGDIFDRHLGARSSLKLERGLNDLWTRGGLLYAPPLQ